MIFPTWTPVKWPLDKVALVGTMTRSHGSLRISRVSMHRVLHCPILRKLRERLEMLSTLLHAVDFTIGPIRLSLLNIGLIIGPFDILIWLVICLFHTLLSVFDYIVNIS